MAKSRSRSQSLSFKDVTGNETITHTQLFRPRRRAKSEFHQIWHCVQEVRASFISKTFSHPMHSFEIGGAENLGKRTPALNPITHVSLEWIPKYEIITMEIS